jgi:hypothetical protein
LSTPRTKKHRNKINTIQINFRKSLTIRRFAPYYLYMSCLTTERRAEYQAQLDKLETQLTAIETAIDSGVLHVESASLDTNEGKQTTKYRSAKELYEAHEFILARIDRLRNILRGTGVVNLNLRRKSGRYGGIRSF